MNIKSLDKISTGLITRFWNRAKSISLYGSDARKMFIKGGKRII